MLKLVPVIVDPSRDHGFGPDSSRRNPFAYYPQTRSNNGHLPQYPSSPLTQCVWTFFWLAMLIFVAYPMGLLCGQLYVLLSPLSALSCCKPLAMVLSLLLEGLHLPLHCTNNMAAAKPLFII